MRPERQHHHAAVGKLADERVGNSFGGGGDHDAVVGRPLRQTGKTISYQHLDVVVAQRRQSPARCFRQRPIPLHTDHFAREPRENGGLVAGAGAHFEHAMACLHAELLGHEGNHIRLADGLPACDRQRLVRIRFVHERAFNEVLARHLVHGPQHRRIADAAPAQAEQELHTADIVVAGRLLGHAEPPCRL